MIAMVVLTIGNITAQTHERTVRGFVLDKKTGAPISGAEVVATGSGETTITDSDGSFSLSIPPFLKFLTATYTGMGSKKMKVNFNSDMIFEMKPKHRFGFLSAVGCFSIGNKGYTDESYIGGGGGLMGGMLGEWGFYAKATIDSQDCPVITAGVIKSVSKSFYGFLGVGWGKITGEIECKGSYWHYDDTNDFGYPLYYDYWEQKHNDAMAFELGCIFKVSRHFNIIVSDTFATDFNTFYDTDFDVFRNTVNVGVGYVF